MGPASAVCGELGLSSLERDCTQHQPKSFLHKRRREDPQNPSKLEVRVWINLNLQLDDCGLLATSTLTPLTLLSRSLRTFVRFAP